MNPLQQFYKARQAETASWQQAHIAGRRVAGLLGALPDDGHTYYTSYPEPRIDVTYFTYGKAEEIRSAVQEVLRTPAQRVVDKTDGSVAYRFTAPGLVVDVRDGRLAPGCKIEAYEETVTRYRSVCEDGTEEAQ